MSSGGASFEQHANKRRRPPAGPQRLTLSVQDADDAAAAVVPPVTVVLDGRCICHRVHLNRHTGYRSLAGTLRRMFVDSDDDDSDVHNHHHQQQQQQRGEDDLDLANAVPGHVVAYEDMEDDLLLAGDLKWNDFVRVAKRIRIIPAKKTTSSSSRAKKCGGGDVNHSN
ncbi:Auxin-responsive protein IAA33 [Zea mays]|uniref:Auxin-responsive protein n=1 Tax=Zea mays TaxID=4577 RepID=A0A3L6G906_MAIZE|nr:Auxin-responsive protein IAA33 [Zea mays]